jgi:hypothetical protein
MFRVSGFCKNLPEDKHLRCVAHLGVVNSVAFMSCELSEKFAYTSAII